MRGSLNLGGSPEEVAGNAHRQFVKVLFDGLSPYYELITTLISGGVVHWWYELLYRVAVERARRTYGGTAVRILDVATGTGMVAFRLAESLSRLGIPADIHGVDISEKMIEIARKKNAKRQFRGVKVTFSVGDACALPYQDRIFDIVTVTFGLRNMSEPARCVREVYRVLRSSGSFLILEVCKPINGLVPREVLRFIFGVVVPMAGVLSAGMRVLPYAYFWGSILHFFSAEELLGVLMDSGFSGARCLPLTGKFCYLVQATKD